MRNTLVLWLAVLTVLCGSTQGAVFSEIVEVHPDHPRKCYDTEVKAYFDINDVWRRDDECSKISCHENEGSDAKPNTLRIQGESCNTVSTFPSNCRLTTPSLYAVYPYCCPILDCEGEPEGPITAVG